MNTPLPYADTRIGLLVSGSAWPTFKASILTENGGHEVLRKQPGLPIGHILLLRGSQPQEISFIAECVCMKLPSS